MPLPCSPAALRRRVHKLYPPTSRAPDAPTATLALSQEIPLGRDDMGLASTNSHTNTIGALAAGKLLAKATGGRWGPAILILAGIVLLRKRAAVKAARNARMAALAVDDHHPRY